MKLATLVMLSISTALFSCSSDSKQATLPNMIALQDIQAEWELTNIDNKAVKIASHLAIDNQAKASGNLACNHFFGNIEIKENKLRINTIGSTRKMCTPEKNDVEALVNSTLSQWSEVTISLQKLILAGEKHTLIYTKK